MKSIGRVDSSRGLGVIRVIKEINAIGKNLHLSGLNVMSASCNKVRNCRTWPMYSSGEHKSMAI